MHAVSFWRPIANGAVALPVPKFANELFVPCTESCLCPTSKFGGDSLWIVPPRHENTKLLRKGEGEAFDCSSDGAGVDDVLGELRTGSKGYLEVPVFC